jgi:hypothetical protein
VHFSPDQVNQIKVVPRKLPEEIYEGVARAAFCRTLFVADKDLKGRVLPSLFIQSPNLNLPFNG